MLVEPQPQPDLDLARLRAECDRVSLDAAECYQAFRRMGLDYGPAFQAIESIGVGESTVLATLRLPSCVPQPGEAGWCLHPSLMDAALQATLGLSFLDGQTGASAGGLKTAMPFALGALEIFAPCTAAMWALIRYTAGSQAGDRVPKDRPRPVRRARQSSHPLQGILRPDAGPEVVARAGPLGNILLAPIWNSVVPALGTTWPETGARVLVIGGSDEQQQAIRALYPEAHDLVLQHEIAGIAAQLDALGTVTTTSSGSLLSDSRPRC